MNRRRIALCTVSLLSAVWLGLVCPCDLFAQKLQVSSNALGLLCLGTLNGEVNYAVSQHWSVGMSGKYNPFSYSGNNGERQFQMRQRSVAALARWWPWHIYSGWWVSGRIQWQEYNVGGFASPQTEEGQRYGGGVTAGVFAYDQSAFKCGDGPWSLGRFQTVHDLRLPHLREED